MLYIEDWQGSKESHHSIIPGLLVSVISLFFVACQLQTDSYHPIESVEAFSELKAPEFVFNHRVIQKHLHALSKSDHGYTEADKRLREYYQSDSLSTLWINNYGVASRADTLLSYLYTVTEEGWTSKSFGLASIERDMQRLRTLDFDQDVNSVNQVAARLEFLLTKAFLRYAYGQRFGFVNPHRLFNHLDAQKVDSTGKPVYYRGLFDIKMDLPGKSYVHRALHKVKADSLGQYLRDIQPRSIYYQQMKELLASATDSTERKRIICNMERGRWRMHQPINEDEKRIVVNIPSYHLYAYDADSVLDMRVVCGAFKTKTPQLTSHVEWMEINPQWVIPMSILTNDVARHAGDSAYFARNHYRIFDKSTNQQVSIKSVSRAMLLSGKYRVAQESGSHNSLGRVVFRFKNNFSVFLHYTSNPSAFQRESRSLSHGCVRVAKPFELAKFVLDNPDEWLLDRIGISMGFSPFTETGKQYVKQHSEEKEHKLIGYVPVKPRVPLYIIYNTLWPDETGVLKTWPDIYGYDQIIWKHLQTYMQ